MFKSARVVIIALLVMVISTTGLAFAAEDVHWGYEGEEGPTHWADLSPDYALCADGTEQSPIGIPYDAEVNPADMAFSYQPSAINIFNNGHTVQVNYDEGSSVEIDGQTYNLLQFHFHNPSEHTTAGYLRPLEIHFVHSNADGGLAVVGVLVREGDENEALADVFANMPAEVGEPAAVDGATVDASAILPADQSYWRYDGSLTTPPCSEDVKWHVMVDTITASPEQIATFAALHAGNARPLQPLNDREFIVGQMSADMADDGEEAEEGDDDAMAEGEEAKEGDDDAMAEGEEAKEGDDDAMAEGEEAKDGDDAAMAEGEEAKEGNDTAMAEGEEAKEGDDAAMAEGEEAKEGDDDAMAEGEEAKEGDDAAMAEDKADDDMAADAAGDMAPESMPETGLPASGPLTPIGVVVLVTLILGGVTAYSKRRELQ